MKRHLFTYITAGILLIGGGLFGTLLYLQKISFQAAEVSSSVYLEPINFSVKPGGTIQLHVKSKMAPHTVVADGNFSIEFDQRAFDFVSAITNANWQTYKITTSDGVIRWLIIPNTADTVKIVGGETDWGTLNFTAKAEGPATFKLRQLETEVIVQDPGQNPSIYNAVTTVQDAQGQISQEGKSSVSISDPTNLNNLSSPVNISTEEIAYADTAFVFVKLAQSGRATVTFGETPSMENTAQSSSDPSDALTIPLSGLKEKTRYYYQVIVDNESQTEGYRSQVKSFVTPGASSNSKIALTKSVVKAFPTTTRDSAVVYALLKDSDGNLVTDQNLTAQIISGDAQLGDFVSQNGIYQLKISSTNQKKQSVVVAVHNGGDLLGRVTIAFDPGYLPASTPQGSTTNTPTTNSRNILLALLSLLVILGLVFWKLAKAK